MQEPTVPSATPAPGWGAGDIVVGAALYAALFVIMLLVARVLGVTRLPLAPDVRLTLQSVALLLLEALLVLPVWLIAVRRKHGTWQLVGFRRFAVMAGLALPVIYLFFSFMLGGVWAAVIQFMRWPTQDSLTSIFGNNPFAIAVGFVAACIVAPIAEETFFRGFVIGGLRRRAGPIGALLLSAVFFALLHPPLTIFPIIFVLGMFLGLLFLQTGSLWPGILMHAMFNALSFAAQFFLNS